MIVAITGPSGSGKTTLVAGLLEEFSNALPLESYTTRPRRASDPPGEQNFVDDAGFDRMLEEGAFAWTAAPYGSPYRYGTRAAAIAAALKDKERVHIALITVDTVRELRRHAAAQPGEACFIHLYIEDADELKRRLMIDRTRTDIERRLAEAAAENARAASFGKLIHHVDATASPEMVLAQAAHIINLYA